VIGWLGAGGRFPVLVAAGLSLLVGGLPASANALDWSSPRLVDPGHRLLASSCPTPSLCVAVDDAGQALTSTRPAGRTQHWTRRLVDRHGALTGLSCPSHSLCVAVDDAGNVLSSTRPRGGRRTWRIASVDRDSSLTGVSCPSSSFCVAADDQGDVLVSHRPLGGARAWRRVSLDIAGALVGVSCPTAALCVAAEDSSAVVVSARPGGGASSWREVDLTATGAGDLTSVSCPSLSLCVAGDDQGNVLTSTRPTRGARGWKRSDVDAANVVPVDQLGEVGLTGVSCASLVLCVAADGAGDIVSSRSPARGARSWHLTRVGGAPGTSGALSFNAVACQSSSLCLAVDDNGNVAVGAGHRVPVTPAPRCDVQLPGAALVASRVLVFPVRSPDATRFFGCLRPNGTGTELGETLPSTGEYGPDQITGDFGVAGTYADARSISGLVASETCTKYQQSGCPIPNYWIRVVNVSTGGEVDLPNNGASSAVALSPEGAIAWLESGAGGDTTLMGTALHPSGSTGLSGSAQQLDTGAIDPKSLRFIGLTLSWSKNGQTFSRTLQ
jgi:hypothetical protein